MGKLFGRDGIRGEANRYPMDAVIAIFCGQAITYFEKTNHRTRIHMGRTPRISVICLKVLWSLALLQWADTLTHCGVLPHGIAFVTQSMRADAVS